MKKSLDQPPRFVVFFGQEWMQDLCYVGLSSQQGVDAFYGAFVES